MAYKEMGIVFEVEKDEGRWKINGRKLQMVSMRRNMPHWE